ncbi:diguanylate cyclase [Escherichia coli O28ac:NM str. 02-3404]|nr:diguanylate cyclase [Escherichia coli]EFI7899144.1 diguanylate cyclase [Escherichia coli]EZA21723.1 diguanylate cyclase [Escherichia coli O28ac:NM str. 02-3404]HAH9026189.1 diguanylate cyclase [Escherichia coli]HBD0303304.1 diguanylate cyclase [Escherichia coli]
MIKKTTEIDAILLNLNKAIDAHYQWLVSMFHSVVARDASKPERLPGRRVLDESFDHQLRNTDPLNLYLMLLDIDRFKLVNDTYGHLIGDVVLRTLATYLASWTRDYETVYRYGGEEFIIIVKAANDEEACRAGVRICQLVDNHAITHSEGHINITVTAGVSRAFPEEPLDVVIGRADRAMYEGKQTGRNRCMFIDEQNVINRV